MPVRTLLLLLSCFLFTCARRPVFVSVSQPAPHDGILFAGVRIFNGQGIEEACDVLVRGETIAWVGNSTEAPREGNVLVVRGEGRTLLPGLWDAHLHLGAGNGDEAWAASLPDAQRQLEALLHAGVTSVLDAGHDTDSKALLARLEIGALLGPSLLRSTRLYTAPDGHPLPFVRALVPWPLTGLIDMTREVEEPGQALAVLEKDVARECPDFVKMVFSAMPEDSPRLSKELLQQLVQKTHALKRRASIHVGSSREALEAVGAGGDLLMHVPWLDVLTEEEARTLAQSRVPITTTSRIYELAVTLPEKGFVLSPLERANLSSHPGVFRPMPKGFSLKGFPERFFTDDMVRYDANLVSNLKRLHAAGAHLVLGTDSGLPGIIHGGAVHREMERLTSLGIPALEVLAMATSRPAKWVGRTEKSGVIATGAQADLVLVEGNPAEKISDTQRIVGVWQRGRAIERF